MIAGFCFGPNPHFMHQFAKKSAYFGRHFSVTTYAPNWIYVIDYQLFIWINILIAIDCKLDFVSLLASLL
jgi:mRNA deadenylase 3'-5' endonuclease subunit Ccr4